jgi:hypothetical protein
MRVVAEGRCVYAKCTENKSPATVQHALLGEGNFLKKKNRKNQTTNDQYIKNKMSTFQKQVG